MFTFGLIDSVFNLSLSKWAVFVIDALVALIILKLIYFLMSKVLKIATSKTKTEFDDDLVKVLQYPLLIVIFVIFLLITIGPLGLSDDLTIRLWQLGKTIILGMVVWFVYGFVGIFYKNVLSRLAEKTHSNFDDQLYPLLRKVLRILIIFFGFIYLLKIWAIDITPVLAGVGVGGLALAFAAQKMIADLFGGVVIFTDKPFKINDRVKIDDSYGIVKEVGLRSTKIENFDGNIVVIPNSKVAESLVENYAKPSPRFVMKMNLGLTYDTPVSKLKLAKEIIKKILENCDGVIKDTTVISFNEFKDWALNIYVEFKIKDVANKNKFLDKINFGIKKEFESKGINFAYPTQTVILEKSKKKVK